MYPSYLHPYTIWDALLRVLFNQVVLQFEGMASKSIAEAWGTSLRERALAVMDYLVLHRETELKQQFSYVLGMIHQSWGFPINTVFYHMGLVDDSQQKSDALYDLIQGCVGSGICIADNFEAELDKASEVLVAPSCFDPYPVYVEDVFDNDLIWEVMVSKPR